MTKPFPAPSVPAEGRGGAFEAAALAWAAFVFACFFFSPSHPLWAYFSSLAGIFDPGPLLSAADPKPAVWAQSIFILLASLAMAGGTWALGRRLRRWFRLEPGDSWVRFAFDFGFGLLGLDLFWMGTGLVRLWYPPVWIGLGLALSALLLLDWAGPHRPLFPKPDFRWAAAEPGLFLLLGLGLVYFLFSALQNLAPETFYDSMVYHLAVPSYWLLHHGLADFPTNFFSNYPAGAELYFLNGLVGQGTEAAKMLHLACFGACALLAAGWAREMAGERAGRLTLGLLLTFPLAVVNTWSTQVEGFLSLATVLFAYALARFLRKDPQREAWALAAGLFAGLALCVKYTALPAVGSALVWWAVQKKDAFQRENRKAWLGLALGALLLPLPWVLKNLCFTGNPVFPYFLTHFPGRHLSPAGYGQLLREQQAPLGGWRDWLALPWTLTLGQVNDNHFCGPVALALAPLLLLFRLRHPVLKFLAGWFLLQLAFGLAVTHLPRFLLPAFVILFLLLGCLLGGGDRPVLGKAAVHAAWLAALLCFPYLADMSRQYDSCAGLWSGRQTREDYLDDPARRSPYGAMARWISGHLPKDKGLLVVGDARGLYYDRPFLTNSVFDEQVLAGLARRERDAEGIGRRLRELGVDELAVNGIDGVQVANQYTDYDPYDLSEEEWKRLDDFIQRDTSLLYQSGAQGVYRIGPARPAAAKGEIQDLVLLFSKPAAHFIRDLQSRPGRQAEQDLDRTAALYPFSRFWKDQKTQFERQEGTPSRN